MQIRRQGRGPVNLDQMARRVNLPASHNCPGRRQTGLSDKLGFDNYRRLGIICIRTILDDCERDIPP
jgi:hypothetical protein